MNFDIAYKIVGMLLMLVGVGFLVYIILGLLPQGFEALPASFLFFLFGLVPIGLGYSYFSVPKRGKSNKLNNSSLVVLILGIVIAPTTYLMLGSGAGMGGGSLFGIICWVFGLTSFFLFLAGGGIPESFFKPSFFSKTPGNLGFLLAGGAAILLSVPLYAWENSILAVVTCVFGIVLILVGIKEQKRNNIS